MLPVKSNLLPTVARFFDDNWNPLIDWSNRNSSITSTTIPAVNMRETANEFIVEMAAPGMKKEDFKIELNNGLLTILSEMQRDDETNNDNSYYRREFSYQSFKRTFNLNDQLVDDTQIQATYQNGILQLNLPKREEAKEKPPRNIEIS